MDRSPEEVDDDFEGNSASEKSIDSDGGDSDADSEQEATGWIQAKSVAA